MEKKKDSNTVGQDLKKKLFEQRAKSRADTTRLLHQQKKIRQERKILEVFGTFFCVWRETRLFCQDKTRDLKKEENRISIITRFVK